MHFGVIATVLLAVASLSLGTGTRSPPTTLLLPTVRPTINCRLVLCAPPPCLNPFPSIPAFGLCCPTCPRPKPPPTKPPLPTVHPTLDCRLVLCARPTCPNPLPPPPGQCCPICLEDCRVRFCPRPPCPNPLPPPPGRCCSRCPATRPPPTKPPLPTATKPPLPTATRPPATKPSIQTATRPPATKPSLPTATRPPATKPSLSTATRPPATKPSLPTATRPPATRPPATKPSLPTATRPPATKPSLPTATRPPATKPSLPTATRPPATRPPATKPSLPTATRPPATKPSLPTATRPPATKPSLPTATRPPATKPSLPTATRPPATKPSLPTATRPPATKPSLPTATRPPATKPSLPTVHPTIDCRLVRCARPTCPNPLPPLPGQCCPRCLENCRVRLCLRPPCPNPLPPPPGRCCSKCPTTRPPPTKPPLPTVTKPPLPTATKPPLPTVTKPPLPTATKPPLPTIRPTIDCRLVTCARPNCPNPLPPLPGQCCPRCLEDCRVRLCIRPPCPNPLPPPPGRCCSRCPVSPPTCPPDKPTVNCFADPCQVTSCPAHPEARCVSDFCGGCNARFFDDNECPVEGQLFTRCGSACPPNCTNPSPICTRQCVARCECPRGKVIDERKNKCVPVNQCADLCELPADPGPCRAYFPSFFFNATSDQCERFIYGGCRGNANRFKSLAACQGRCNLCKLRPDSGPCLALIRSYFFNSSSGRCEAFNYGGCKGNANRFPSLTACQRACGPSCPIKGQVFQACRPCPATCDNPRVVCPAVCRSGCGCPSGKIIDAKNKRCVKPRACPNVCTLPQDPGRCKAHIPSYFFNSTSKRCERFIYGGCGGNGNRFTSLQHCKRRCGSSGSCPPVCSATFCRRNRRALCTFPGPREIPGCTGRCQVTYCHACYFSKQPRLLPGKCSLCGAPVTNLKCLKQWTFCIHLADKLRHGWPSSSLETEKNFKCYRYPCPLRG